MAAHHRSQLARDQDQRRDVKARLPLDLLADFTLALDHDDASQSRPFVAFLKPSYIMDRRVGSGFAATVIAIHRFIAGELAGLGEAQARRQRHLPRYAADGMAIEN